MRLFIADGNSANRLALQLYLHQEPGLYVIGMTAEARSLLAQVEASQPEILLLDWQLPGATMPELLTGIRKLEGAPEVIVLSVNPEVEVPALAAGAIAFINKNAPPDALLDVLRSLVDDGPVEDLFFPESKKSKRPGKPKADLGRIMTLEDQLKALGKRRKKRAW
jgi:DNA-binding NarL/FixJ family response regulator